MSDSRLLDVALHQMQQGQVDGAVGMLTRFLAEAPDDARAHAYLALCLRDLHRLTVAAGEARIALALDPTDPLVLMANGVIAYANRRPKDAEAFVRHAFELEPTWAWPARTLASFYMRDGRMSESYEWIKTARALDPDDDENALVEASWQLEQGNASHAETIVRDILSTHPANVGALRVLSYALLRQGRTAEAQEHALWAVRNSPNRESISLLVAVKMRRNPITGLWWRVNAFFSTGSSTRIVAGLLLTYVAYRVLTLLLEDAGHPQVAQAFSYAWLAFCVYTWVGPVMFQNALRRALKSVRLRDDF